MIDFVASLEMMVFTCEHIFYEGRPITYVFHDENDYWLYLCDKDHLDEEALIVKLKQLYNFDMSIAQLAELPQGKQAKRETPRDPWVIF